MKHSPGPWMHVGLCRVVDSGGSTIATYQPPRDPKEAEANANLIAAAPELLAALRAVVASVKPQRCMFKAWEQALRAIVKAEGNHE